MPFTYAEEQTDRRTLDLTDPRHFAGFDADEIRAVMAHLRVTAKDIAQQVGEPDLCPDRPEDRGPLVWGLSCWIWRVGNEGVRTRGGYQPPVGWRRLPAAVRDFYVRASHVCGEDGRGNPDRKHGLPLDWPRDRSPWVLATLGDARH